MDRFSRPGARRAKPLRPTAMTCPSCHKLISATADQCIHCGHRKPAAYTRLPILGELIREDLRFTNFVIMISATLYILALALDLPSALEFGSPFDLMGPSGAALYKLGMSGWVPVVTEGRWWTLLTANYLHADILHIAFNMLWLRRLGVLVEELYGSSRFVILYTVAGLVGSVVSTLAGTSYFVGASGAVFGLFAALIYYGYRRGGLFGRGIFRSMLLFAVIGLALGMMPNSNVDNWGHIGGFLGGLGMAFVLGYSELKPLNLKHHVGAFATLVGIAAIFVFMFVAFFL